MRFRTPYLIQCFGELLCRKEREVSPARTNHRPLCGESSDGATGSRLATNEIQEKGVRQLTHPGSGLEALTRPLLFPLLHGLSGRIGATNT